MALTSFFLQDLLAVFVAVISGFPCPLQFPSFPQTIPLVFPRLFFSPLLIWFLNLDALSFSMELSHHVIDCVLHRLVLETWLGWLRNEDMTHRRKDRYTYRNGRLMWAVLALMKGTDYITQKLSTFISGQCFLHTPSAFCIHTGSGEGFVIFPTLIWGRLCYFHGSGALRSLTLCQQHTFIQDSIYPLHIHSGLLTPTPHPQWYAWLDEWTLLSWLGVSSASWIHHVIIRWLNMPYYACTLE